MSKLATIAPPRTSRAVVRMAHNIVDILSQQPCAGCGSRNAWPFAGGGKKTGEVVVANVYSRGRWRRCEFWHPSCYDAAGQPYGPPDASGATARPRPKLAGRPKRKGVL